MERERERYIARGRISRQKAWYGHSDGAWYGLANDRAQYGLAGEDSDLPQKWSLRSCSVLLRPGSVLRSQSVCHEANLLGMKREVKMRRGLTLM